MKRYKSPQDINKSTRTDREIISLCLHEIDEVRNSLINHLHHHEIYEVTIIGGIVVYIISQVI